MDTCNPKKSRSPLHRNMLLQLRSFYGQLTSFQDAWRGFALSDPCFQLGHACLAACMACIMLFLKPPWSKRPSADLAAEQNKVSRWNHGHLKWPHGIIMAEAYHLPKRWGSMIYRFPTGLHHLLSGSRACSAAAPRQKS